MNVGGHCSANPVNLDKTNNFDSIMENEIYILYTDCKFSRLNTHSRVQSEKGQHLPSLPGLMSESSDLSARLALALFIIFWDFELLQPTYSRNTTTSSCIGVI